MLSTSNIRQNCLLVNIYLSLSFDVQTDQDILSMNRQGGGLRLKMEKGWEELLKNELHSDNFCHIKEFLEAEIAQNKTVYPPMAEVFNAFNQTPPDKVKIVILGQDPYHGPGQAHGLSFSVKEGVKFPPSLRNIFKELNADLGVPIPTTGNLETWSRQGVFLLNSILTVRAGEPGSHQKTGWEQFTDAVIRLLSEERNGLVFLLWGRFAAEKEKLIDTARHHVLKAAHPSPLSAYNGFFGCRHFSKANDILINSGNTAVNWEITNKNS